MKVLMFGWEFPPHISGGLGTACYGLTKGMSTIPGLDVLFVVPKAYGNEDSKVVNLIGANNVPLTDKTLDYQKLLEKIKLLEVKSNLVPYASPEEYEKLQEIQYDKEQVFINTSFKGKIDFEGGYGHNLFQEIANYAIVASFISRDHDFDIIHAHDWLTYPAGIAAKKASGKKLIVHVHATDFDRSGGNVNPGVFNIEQEGMMAADLVIAVSNLTRDTIIHKYHIDPAKVVTVYNAVEPLTEIEKYRIKKGFHEKVVTFLGRITMQKGPEYYIEAAYKVLQKTSNARFVMAGSGDMLTKMIHRASSLGIMDKFHFTGFLKGSDVYNLFSISDAYVMPSVSEPFGISPLEAMQSNVPVIISHQSGVSEILKHAIKVDFWDINAMADAIYAILHYDGLPRMFKKMGRTEVDNLKWENSARQVHTLYEKMLEKE